MAYNSTLKIFLHENFRDRTVLPLLFSDVILKLIYHFCPLTGFDNIVLFSDVLQLLSGVHIVDLNTSIEHTMLYFNLAIYVPILEIFFLVIFEVSLTQLCPFSFCNLCHLYVGIFKIKIFCFTFYELFFNFTFWSSLKFY